MKNREKSASTSPENTDLKLGVPIIMRSFSAIEVAQEDQRFAINETALHGNAAAIVVGWSEKHGDTVTSNLEQWNALAPDMWLATSRKK